MIPRTTLSWYGTSRCDDHVHVVKFINTTGMDKTYGTYVDDECFDIHDYDDDTGHDTDDDTDDDANDDINDDIDDDTDGGGRGNRRPLLGRDPLKFELGFGVLPGEFPCWEAQHGIFPGRGFAKEIPMLGANIGISLAVHFPFGVLGWVAFAKRNQPSFALTRCRRGRRTFLGFLFF